MKKRALVMMALLFCMLVNAHAALPRIALMEGRGAGEEARMIKDIAFAKLSGDPSLEFVERSDLQLLVNEWLLSAGADPSLPERRMLAHQLGADLLIFVSQENRENETILISFAICEAETGLQIAAAVERFHPQKPEVVADVMVDSIARAVRQVDEPFLWVCAVPPFECLDVSFEAAGMGKALALAAERALLARGRTAVAELSEVDALAQELSLQQETKFQRELPHYVVGSYRTRSEGSDRMLSISLTRRQGGEKSPAWESGWIPEREVHGWLQQGIEQLFPRGVHDAAGANRIYDAAAEAGVLTGRGHVFMSIGEYDMAEPLLKAAALLDPDGAGPHFGLAHLYGLLVQNQVVLKNDQEALPEFEQQLVHYLRSFNDSLSILLAGKMPINKLSREMYVNRSIADLRAYAYDFESDPSGVRDAYVRELLRQADLYRAVLTDPKLKPTHDRDLFPLRHCLNMNLNKLFALAPGACWDHLVWLLKEQWDSRVPLHRLQPNIEELILPGQPGAINPDGNFHEELLVRLQPVSPDMADYLEMIGKWVHAVKDDESKENALASLPELGKRYHLVNQDMNRLKGALESLPLDEAGAEASVSEPPVFQGPQIRLVPLLDHGQHDAPVGAPMVRQWLVTEAGEYIAELVGIRRLAPGGGASLISSEPAYHLSWDGELLWAVQRHGICALSPDGRVRMEIPANTFISFDPSRTRVCGIVPRTACVVDSLDAEGIERVRSWAALVRADLSASKPLVDVFHEERVADRALDLSWIERVQVADAEPSARVLVGNRKHSRLQLLDPVRRIATYLPHRYPDAPLFVRWGTKLLMAHGNRNRQNRANLVVIHEMLEAPQPFMNLGSWEHVGWDGRYVLSPYYQAGAVHGRYLHLIAGRLAYPEWTVVDLENLRVRVGRLGEARNDGSDVEALVDSPRHGLLAIKNGAPYRVVMPPFEELPPLPQKP